EALDLTARARHAGVPAERVAPIEAECAHRRGDFAAAARALHEAGRDTLARRFEGFAGRTPWRIAGPARGGVAFVQTDPLPALELTVNGHGPLLVILDTGGGELVLDPTLADSLGVVRYGAETGTFAGGRRRSVELGRVDSVAVGPFTLHDVPVDLL